MSEQFYIVVNQVLVFGILMLIGFVMAQLKIIGKDMLDGLSRLIIKLLLPCMIFDVIIGNGVTIERIMENRYYAIGVLTLYFSLCLLGYMLAGAGGLRRSGQDAFAVACMFCNIGFMGVPLIQKMFPGDTQVAVCLSIYMTLDQLLLWSIGLFLCTRNAKRKGSNFLKNFLNPSLIGIFIALALIYFNVQLPAPVMTTVRGLGDCSRYLALLYLGALLATMPVFSMLTRPYVYLLIVLKMTVFPVLVFFIGSMFFDYTTSMVLTTIASLPPMVAVTMMARTYGGDERVATEAVFVSTIACLGTIPLVQFLLEFLF